MLDDDLGKDGPGSFDGADALCAADKGHARNEFEAKLCVGVGRDSQGAAGSMEAEIPAARVQDLKTQIAILQRELDETEKKKK